MRCVVLIGQMAILLFLVAACGEVDSTSTPSATQESPASAPTPTTDRPNASRSPSPDIELSGDGTWVLNSLDGRPVIEESVITLRIEDNWFDGIDGCNSYGGRSEEGTPVASADKVFSIPPFAVTVMLCPEPDGIMDQADAYMAALVQGEKFRIADDRLEILDSGGATRLIFVKRAPLPGSPIDLEGTAWRLLIEGDAVDSVRSPTLAFLDDRLATGATACRSYVATYRVSEGALRFPGKSMLSSPQSWQSCSENERTLEGEFGDFLTWAREYSVDREGGLSRLRIWSIRGKMLTFEPLPQAVEDTSDTDWSLMAFVELRLDSGMWHHRTTSVVQGSEVTIGFDEHGIGGFMGCNSYGGPAKVEDGSVTVDRYSFFSTAMLCEEPDGLIGQEKRYFSLVQRATRYGIYGDSLFMQTDDNVFLLFQTSPSWEAPPPPEPVPTQASRPAPIVFELGWEADKSLIAPGEPVTVTLDFKNVWDRPVVFSDFPTTMTLTDVDKRIEEPVPLRLQSGRGVTGRMEPGEELVVMVTVSPSVSAGLQPGRYSLEIHRLEIRFQIAHTPGIPEMGQKRLGLGSGILFVVFPPEGALERSVVVGQALEGSGARVTLDSLHFSPEETRIVALAEPSANGSAVPRPALAATPTPIVSSQSPPTPTPTPVGGQPGPVLDRDIFELTAFYRLDGSAWRRLGDHRYRVTTDGAHHEWSFGPVSADANTFEFAIIPGVRPGSDGVFDYPTGDGASPWEWTVPLQEIEEP